MAMWVRQVARRDAPTKPLLKGMLELKRDLATQEDNSAALEQIQAALKLLARAPTVSAFLEAMDASGM